MRVTYEQLLESIIGINNMDIDEMEDYPIELIEEALEGRCDEPTVLESATLGRIVCRPGHQPSFRNQEVNLF